MGIGLINYFQIIYLQSMGNFCRMIKMAAYFQVLYASILHACFGTMFSLVAHSNEYRQQFVCVGHLKYISAFQKLFLIHSTDGLKTELEYFGCCFVYFALLLEISHGEILLKSIDSQTSIFVMYLHRKYEIIYIILYVDEFYFRQKNTVSRTNF